MVVYYHKAMCHEQKLVHYLQRQGHSKGLYNQNITLSTLSSKFQVRLKLNLVDSNSILSQSVMWKIFITVFKIKVTAKVQNVSECLSG